MDEWEYYIKKKLTTRTKGRVAKGCEVVSSPQLVYRWYITYP